MFLSCVAALLIVALGVFVYGWALVQQPYRGYLGEIVVEIPAGFGSQEIIELLFSKGVVRSRHAAIAYLYLSPYRGKLQAGEYLFDQAVNVEAVLRKLAHGEIRLHKFTVPEGLILSEIAELWARNQLGPRDEFLAAAQAALPLAQKFVPSAISVEGYLFPETYSFRLGVTAAEGVEAMLQGFAAAVSRLEEAVASDTWPLDLKETVIMASLIESEAGIADERPLISSVFHNRLRRGMLLECDPTVIYALRLEGSYRGRLLRVDLDFDSPYNTYMYPKLPPGPIANPGYHALLAAIAPAESDFLFFVRSDGGRHAFSRTLAEHNRAVAAYRRSLGR